MINFIKRLAFNITMIGQGKRTLAQSINLLKYRISSKKPKLSYKPIMLSILSIHRCNLACNMCLTHSKELGDHPYRHMAFSDMSIEMFRDIIARFPEAIAVGFVGNGEPLLNKDIFKMIDHAERSKMRTFMISNGVILPDYIDKILDSRLSEISISVNTNTAQDYERLTGMSRENFDTICAASINLIERKKSRKKNITIDTSFILDRGNFKEIQKMINMSSRMGFDQASFYNILPLTEKRASSLSLYDNEETLSILRNVKFPGGKMKINLPIPLDGNTNNNICDDFFTSINIDGNANVGGCNRQRFDIHDKGKYYNNDVWNNTYFVTEREKFLSNSTELDEPCRVCFANSSYVKRSIK